MLPEWIPAPDAVFASLVLSTFPDPGLAMDGLIRSIKKGGKLIVLDWMKNEYSIGPKINDKISLDKMKFLAELYHLDIVKNVRISEHVYGLEVVAGKILNIVFTISEKKRIQRKNSSDLKNKFMILNLINLSKIQI